MLRVRVLDKTFFEQPTLAVARELLGKYLVRRCPLASASTEQFDTEFTAEGLSRMSSLRRHKYVVAMITEVETYDGPHDKASHASRGLTKRNAPMFGPAGRWYVYFTYGMHWMLNIVTRERGYPAAVLIRGVSLNTNRHESGHEWTRMIHGPARVTKFFKIDKRFNGKSATRVSGLWIENRGVRIRKGLRWQSHRESTTKSGQIAKGKRIGVEYAGPVWAKKKWNLKMKNGGPW